MRTYGVLYCVYLTGGYDMTSVNGDGNPVSKGDAITDFRGDACTLDSAEIPRHAASTGRVNNFFPSVFGLKWVVV